MNRINQVTASVTFFMSLGALLTSACGTGSETDLERAQAEIEGSTPGAAASNAGSTTYTASTTSTGSTASAGGTTSTSGAPSTAGSATSTAGTGGSSANEQTGAGGTTPDDTETGTAAAGMGADRTNTTPADTQDPDAPTPAAGPSLGAASGFAILASSTVTCANSSVVSGDVGVSPGTAISGFDASCTLTGALHAKDPSADAAQADLLATFDSLGAAVCETDLTGQELGGLTLPPGVYCFDTTAGVTGALTLDAGGDANGVWIFQVGTALTTATGSSVAMAGNGDPCGVFWRVGSSATLGTTSSFKGNILALASVTLTSGSSLAGRALALTAAVTSDNNAVSLAECSL